MPDPDLLRLFEQLRALRFVDLQGAHVSALIPVSERLLNALVGAWMPRARNVRDLSVHLQAANRLAVRAKLPRVDFLPPVSINLLIERQPELPDSPLVLRLMTFPGLMRLIGAALPIASSLPPGIRMDKDRIYVDLRTLAERYGYADLLPLLKGLRVTTEPNTLIVEVDVRI